MPRIKAKQYQAVITDGFYRWTKLVVTTETNRDEIMRESLFDEPRRCVVARLTEIKNSSR